MNADSLIFHPFGLTQNTIAAIGMFDGVHRGHLHLLAALKTEAALRGLTPLVVTFSNHPLQIIAPAKAPALLSTPQEKEALLRQTGVEVTMLTFDEAMRQTTAAGFLRMLRRDYGVERLLLGFNNRFGHDAPHDFESYRALGWKEGVIIEQADEFMPEGTAASSSEIRRRIAAGDMAGANRLLGRPYSLTGTVGHGKAIGRTLGFPTANVTPCDQSKLIPARGVYAAVATTADGRRHAAVVNIGSRPTVERPAPGESAEAPLSVEAFLNGFSGDLYGQNLTLEFIGHLRQERRFPSLDALKKAIAADAEQAAAIVKDIL